MSQTTEQIQNAHRQGATFGLSLAEVILIVLFVILLLLIFSEGERESAEEALASAIDLENSEVPPDWIAIVTEWQQQGEEINSLRGQLEENEKENENLVQENNSLAAETTEQDVENSALKDQINQLRALAESFRGGDTTICTYLPADDEDFKQSISLASIWVKNDHIIFLEGLIDSPENIIDYYLSPYDPSEAIAIINKYSTGDLVSREDFSITNQSLDQIGDNYETETRARCRYTYDYYFENDLPTDSFDRFFTRYLKGTKLDEEYVSETLSSVGVSIESLGISPLSSSELQQLPENFGETDISTAENAINTTISTDRLNSVSEPLIEIQSEIIEPELISSTRPEYPRQALRRGITGVVILNFYVNESGEPFNIQVVESPNQALQNAAIESLMSSIYRPKLEDDKPVISDIMTRSFRFE